MKISKCREEGPRGRERFQVKRHLGCGWWQSKARVGVFQWQEWQQRCMLGNYDFSSSPSGRLPRPYPPMQGTPWSSTSTCWYVHIAKERIVLAFEVCTVKTEEQNLPVNLRSMKMHRKLLKDDSLSHR